MDLGWVGFGVGIGARRKGNGQDLNSVCLSPSLHLQFITRTGPPTQVLCSKYMHSGSFVLVFFRNVHLVVKKRIK